MVTSAKINLPFFVSQDSFVHGLLFPVQVTASHARSNSEFPPKTNDYGIIELISTAHLLVEGSLLSMIIRNKGSKKSKLAEIELLQLHHAGLISFWSLSQGQQEYP